MLQHFNVCLYHSVEECIRAGRKVFEPGAGGEHKVSRGFEPTPVHSAHLIFDQDLNRAVRDFLRCGASGSTSPPPWRRPSGWPASSPGH